jgi:putative DNA primase/helicase
MAKKIAIDIDAERKKLVPKNVLISDTPLETAQQRGELIFPHMNNGKPLSTIDNLKSLLRSGNIRCRYNVISKRNEMSIPGEIFTIDNVEPASLACIFSRMKEMLMPTDGYADYLLKIGDENQYNPVLNFVRQKPWDGFSRLPEMYETIQSPENEAKQLLMRRWFITAIHMAIGSGVDSAGCLVLQGAQDLGKTWWARKLLPEELRDELIRTGASIDPTDRDSVSQFVRYWIVELGEIGHTFDKSHLGGLKAFITNKQDILRRPYGKGDQVYPRRTAIIASVDQTIYLHDTAGNRRFWTIPCTAVDSYHKIDMQQFWAEILYLIENDGEGWQLLPDEKAHIIRINESHMQIDPIYEKILERYNWEYECNDLKSATQIAEYLGIKNITQRETRLISTYIMSLNGNKREERGAKRFFVPYTLY